jgi:hypothetical protein
VEISAVIAGLNCLPQNMKVWLSTDSQYVQKGVNEWMPKWKRNGWRNSKKAGIANKSRWLGLDSAISRHERVEFTWVKAHSGILHNEIADTLATRGVNGGTYSPVSWFDQLPADTETEDDPNIPQTEVITQTDKFGADEEHLPQFGTLVRTFGFNEEEAAERAEERERGIRQFVHNQLENSSTPVSEDEELPQPSDTVVILPGWSGVEGPAQDLNLSELQWGNPKEAIVEEEQEQNQVTECSLRVRRGIGEETTDPDVPTSWSSTWAQAQAGAQYIRDMEERFSWMKEADKGMLYLGLEPYPWEQFAEAIERTGETEFQAIEQRGNGGDVLREKAQMARNQ